MRTEEALEQVITLVHWHAEPVVPHPHHHLGRPRRGALHPRIDLDDARGLRAVTVLDGVREIVRETELHRRRIHLDIGHPVGDADLHTGGLGRIAHGPLGLARRFQEVHVAMLPRILRTHARERQQVLHGVPELVRVLGDDAHEPVALLRGEVGDVAHHVARPEHGPDLVLDLVRYRSVEGAQPVL